MGIDTIQDVPTIGFNRALDFCVWVLEFDGLQAPPFDRHGDGDGSLQALGLDPGTWQVWVAQVAAALGQRVVYQEQLRAHHAELDGRYQPLFRKDAAQANERGSPGRPTLLPARVGLLGRYLGTRGLWVILFQLSPSPSPPSSGPPIPIPSGSGSATFGLPTRSVR
jgi:hypothetical protein